MRLPMTYLEKTIEQTKDHEAIISMILLKIVNNSFSAGLLYRYNPHLELVKTTGHFEYNSIKLQLIKYSNIVINDKLCYTLI